MASTMSFITSNKGKPLLARDSYIYYVSKTTATVKYWRCEDRSCNAGVHTNNKDVFIKTVGIHSEYLESLLFVVVKDKTKKLIKND